MSKSIALPNGEVVVGVPDHMTTGGLLDEMVQKGTITIIDAAEILSHTQNQDGSQPYPMPTTETYGRADEFLIGAGEWFADRSQGLVDNDIRAPGTGFASLGRAAPSIVGSFAVPGSGVVGILSQAGLHMGLEAAREGATPTSIAGQGVLAAGGTAGGNMAGRVISGIGKKGKQIRQTLGTKLDSDYLRRIEAGISSGGGFDFLLKAGQKALNRAGAESFGATAERITPRVLLAASERIGKEFDRLLPDDKVFDLGATKAGLDDMALSGNLKALALQIDAKTGTAGGNTLKNLRRALQEKVSALRGQNDDLANQYDEIADALMEEIQEQVIDPVAFRVAREQWKNLRLIEGLPGVRRYSNLTSGQANSAMSRSKTGYGTSFLRDTGTVLPTTQNMFNQIRAMDTLSEIVGDSGTATRLMGLAGIGAGAGYLMEGDLEGAAKGAVIAGAPMALGRLDAFIANRTLGKASESLAQGLSGIFSANYRGSDDDEQ